MSSDSTVPLLPDHPLTHTTPVLVPILHKTARMVVHVPSAMSPGLSAGIGEVAAMSDLAFRKGFRSSYDSKEDEEVKESLDSDSKNEGVKDEGPTAKDKDLAAGDEGLAAGVKGPGVDDESYGLDYESHSMDDERHGLDEEGRGVKIDGLGLEEDEEEAVPRGQQQAAPVMRKAVSAPLGLGYGALRCRELALEGDHVYITFEVDGAQSSRVTVPIPKDPYEAITQTYLVGTDIESEPFRVRLGHLNSTVPLLPDHPLTHTTPVLVPILHKTARMVVHVPSAMSPGLSAGIGEVAAMSDLAFRKGFRSSYDSKEDEEVKESLDSDSKNEGVKDEGPTAKDKDLAAGDEGLAAGVKGPGVDDESYGLDYESHSMDDERHGLDEEGRGVKIDGLGLEEDEEEAVPRGQQQAAPVMRKAVSAPLGLGYGALRCRELALEG
nr:hypothetical protein [Tanacetum cinerariifolium]